MSDLPKAVDTVLDTFARLGPDSERAFLAPILSTSGAAHAARDERFLIGVEKFIEYIRSGRNGRVQAVATLWRLTSVSAMREHRRRILEVLRFGVPQFSELPTEMNDPDDRRHFGDALTILDGDWLPEYIARSIVSEREGDKAREALARALVTKVKSIAEQLRLVSSAFAEIRFEQQDPSTGRARRLASVLEALGEASWAAEADVEPGENFGEALAHFIADVFSRGLPNEKSVAISAVRSIVRFVILVVRLHGTLAADAKTYHFLEPLRRAFGSNSWPNELARDFAKASSQVLEQLVFLLRLGMPDANLRRVYLHMVGEGAGKSRLVKIAEELLIDADSAHWLRTGTARRVLPTQAAVEETAVAVVDRDLGPTLREAEAVHSNIEAIASEVLTAATFHSDRLGEEVKTILERVGRLTSHVQGAARRRGLVLKGNIGEVVEFSPITHEPTSNAIGARSVRVRTKSVERIVDGQSLGVVIKSDVEKS